MRIVFILDWYIFTWLCLKRICQTRYFAALYQGAWFFIFHQNKAILICVHYCDKNWDTLLAIFCSCIITGCVHVSMLLSWFYWKALHQELSLSRRTHPPNLFQEVSTHFFLILCFQLVFWHDMRKSTCVTEREPWSNLFHIEGTIFFFTSAECLKSSLACVTMILLSTKWYLSLTTVILYDYIEFSS